jgi:ubiquinone/menaquinone biosynthesis C-methylase UbiE
MSPDSRSRGGGAPSARSMEQQRRIWGRTYAETPYKELPWYSARPSPWLVEAVESRSIRPPGPILDIGCGAGTNVLWLSARGFRASGLDLAPGAIVAAERRKRRSRSTARFLEGSALAMPFRTSEFRAAMDNGCFHTLPLPQRPQYAAEVARVVRPGGAFLLTWIAREETRKFGPPHRPSLQEVAALLEPSFTFAQTEFYESHSPRSRGYFMARYSARLIRRESAQPPPR